MGNSLLDFVMALVRDPEVAARYAADPAGALADAHLPGVTAADVNNLIPVVTDSLAAATPAFGSVGHDLGPDNVWTSGAAAAALDAFAVGNAFDVHVPPQFEPPQPAVSVPVDGPAAEQGAELSPPAAEPAFDDAPAHHTVDPVGPDWGDDTAWQHPHVEPQIENHQTGHHPGDHQGFELF